MTGAWDLQMQSGQKMVLLSLCDQASDDGHCYPSVGTIARRCSMSERAVQGHIKALETEGFLTRTERTGHSTYYTLNPRRICAPAESAPPQKLHTPPAESAPPPPQNLRPTPAESAPITVSEPSVEPSLKQKQALTRPEGVGEQVWADFLAIRRAKRSPLTTTALQGIEREAEKAGKTLHEALAICCERGWQGFKAEWVAGAQVRQMPMTPSAAAKLAAARTIFGTEIEGGSHGRIIDAATA